MDQVKIEIIPVGMLDANCYILSDSESRQGIIVDPGDEADKITAKVEAAGLKIKYIINTHGHYDHIGANLELKERFGAEILVHEADAPMLQNPRANLSFLKPFIKDIEIKPDRLLKDGDVVSAGAVRLEVLHTPGHSQGSICLLGDGYILTGDTLFEGSIGRTDLPGGSYESIISSINNKLKSLPDEIKVYPGHGPASTIGKEKANNPYLCSG